MDKNQRGTVKNEPNGLGGGILNFPLILSPFNMTKMGFTEFAKIPFWKSRFGCAVSLRSACKTLSQVLSGDH